MAVIAMWDFGKWIRYLGFGMMGYFVVKLWSQMCTLFLLGYWEYGIAYMLYCYYPTVALICEWFGVHDK